MKLTLVLILTMSILSCSGDEFPLPDVDEKLKSELVEYVTENHQTPEDYIIGKFRDHDIVIIGEQHRIKHDVEFIQRLIPLVYEKGVYTLAMEFARREDQRLIDSLLAGEEYDQKLAERIMFLQFALWGYHEYVDIFKAAWTLNSGLAPEARRFRILGMNNSPDWSHIKTQEDRRERTVLRKVWHGETEEDWARVVLGEVVSRGEKALVYCGINHGFSEYTQPVVNFEKQELIRLESNRMGKYLYNEMGKRVITVFMHAPWVSSEGWGRKLVYPVDGVIDVVLRELPPEYRKAGFDTRGTPFGKLSSTTSYHRYSSPDFRLEMFCDGYIIHKPISDYRGVTVVEDFITEENVEYARLQTPDPAFRNAGVDDFIETMSRSADIRRRWSHLH